MAKYEVTHNVHCKTYASLIHTGWHLLDCAEKSMEGSLLNLQAATVFFAFSFEAYLNHVGEGEIPFWAEIDRISYSKKLSVIAKHLNFTINKSQPPFQTIAELFRLRNDLAHGRTQEFTETRTMQNDPPHDAVWRVLPWEKLTPEIVRKFYNDVRSAVETINQARKAPDETVWNSGIRGTLISGPH